MDPKPEKRTEMNLQPKIPVIIIDRVDENPYHYQQASQLSQTNNAKANSGNMSISEQKQRSKFLRRKYGGPNADKSWDND